MVGVLEKVKSALTEKITPESAPNAANKVRNELGHSSHDPSPSKGLEDSRQSQLPAAGRGGVHDSPASDTKPGLIKPTQHVNPSDRDPRTGGTSGVNLPSRESGTGTGTGRNTNESARAARASGGTTSTGEHLKNRPHDTKSTFDPMTGNQAGSQHPGTNTRDLAHDNINRKSGFVSDDRVTSKTTSTGHDHPIHPASTEAHPHFAPQTTPGSGLSTTHDTTTYDSGTGLTGTDCPTYDPANTAPGSGLIAGKGYDAANVKPGSGSVGARATGEGVGGRSVGSGLMGGGKRAEDMVHPGPHMSETARRLDPRVE